MKLVTFVFAQKRDNFRKNKFATKKYAAPPLYVANFSLKAANY